MISVLCLVPSKLGCNVQWSYDESVISIRVVAAFKKKVVTSSKGEVPFKEA